MNKIDWSKEHRQAPLGLILFFADTFRKIVKSIWPLLLVFLFRDREEEADENYYMWMILGASVLVLINAVLSYWYFRYQIVNEELVVKKGYLKKVRLTIPLDRIQSIQIKQNVLQQVLHLVTLEVDTAGAGKAEVKFIAIKEDISDQLKEEFQSKIKSDDVQETSEDDANAEESKEGKLNLKLGLRDLAKVGISENHLRSFLVIVSLFYWAYYQIDDLFEERMAEYTEEGIAMMSEWSFSSYAYLLLFLFGVTLMISFARAFIGFYNLNLKQFSSSFKLQFGLFNLKEFSVPFSKVQVISWHSNPIRKLFRFKSLKIKQASSDESNKRKQQIEIPACQAHHQEEIELALFGEQDTAFTDWIPTHWIYFLQRFIFLSIGAFGVGAYFYFRELPAIPVFISLVVLALIFSILAFKKRKFRLGDTQLELQKGHIATSLFKMKGFKIQSVQYKQTFIMRYRKLATLTVYTAAGKELTLPYIPEKHAWEVYNYLLYKIECSNQPWM
jgi:putative membrane protein